MKESKKPTHCPLCKGDRHNPFLKGFDRLFPRTENYQYVQCADCQMVFLCPHPTLDEINSFYGEDYGPHQSGGQGKIMKRHQNILNQFIIKHYLKTGNQTSTKNGFLKRKLAKLMKKFCMQNLLTPVGQNRLLDVGCGSGSWLYQHHLLGWQAHGVEINQAACERARGFGLTVFQGTLFDVPSDHRYDVITFNHIIEHVLNPVETIEAAKKLLVPGGLLILLLPNLDSHGFRIYGDCWFPLDPPRHILQFSPKTMRVLAEKSGLHVMRICTEAHARLLWKSRNYKRVLGEKFVQIDTLEERQRLIHLCSKRENENRIHKKLFKKGMYFPAKYWAMKNFGEVMQVVLQKPLQDEEANKKQELSQSVTSRKSISHV